MNLIFIINFAIFIYNELSFIQHLCFELHILLLEKGGYCTEKSNFADGSLFWLENADNQTISLMLKESFNFSCKNGFFASGSLLSTCLEMDQNQGQWSNVNGTCESKYCGHNQHLIDFILIPSM